MTTRIVVGYTDTPGGRDALALGVVLADLDPASELTVAAVYGYNPPTEDHPPTGWRKALRDAADRELLPARQAFGTRERTSFTPACGLSPADGLHRLSAELHAAAVVVGVSHEHGLRRVLAGSVTEQTLHGSPCAVAVAPHDYAFGPVAAPRTVAAAYNGSDESVRALQVAGDIARAADARLVVVGVVEQIPVWHGGFMGPAAGLNVRDHIREELERAAGGVRGVRDVETRLRDGEPTRTLVEATADADLVVLGSRGHGPARRVLLGSVSSRIVRESTRPLLVLPRTASDPAAGALVPPQIAEEERAPDPSAP